MGNVDDQSLSGRRWWILATVCCAQFIFGVDAVAVNVALPTIARELDASSAQIQAVMALYFVGYATLVITGGRLGDIYGRKKIFFSGVLGFTIASFWCGTAGSGTELVLARILQGATAALMIPQVLATIHVLFNDESRTRAFALYGIVLGLAGSGGFLLGGSLVSANFAGLGWRSIFFLNVPAGITMLVATLCLMPSHDRRPGSRLDIPGTSLLFLGLLCLIGPLPWGKDLGWSASVWTSIGAGVLVLTAFIRLEFRLAENGAMPLIDTGLLRNVSFMRGLCAVFWIFFAYMSLYLVTVLFIQDVLNVDALTTGLLFLAPGLSFIVAAQHGGERARRKGVTALSEGSAVLLAGLTGLGAVLVSYRDPPIWLLECTFVVFAYGQGLVMAPLSNVVLSSVPPAAAGAASGMYATTTQGANAAGIGVVGAIYFTASAAWNAQAAVLASYAAIAASIVFGALCLQWMRWASSESGPATNAAILRTSDAPTE